MTTLINFAYRLTMNEIDLKKEFAECLLKYPNDPFKAALEVFPDDNGIALKMANEWPIDKEVLAFKKELLKDRDPLDFVPQKAELAMKIWNAMNTPGIYVEDLAKLGKLYHEIIKKEEKGGEVLNSLGDAFAEISKRLPV